MKFISWNVNGIRACVTKGFLDYFKEVDADIFCLQETKLQEGQIDLDLEGFVPYESGLVFFDENEKEIGFSCSSSENKNKKTGRITTTINLEGYGNDLNLISKIKKVSAYNNTKMRLLYDEAIEINLSN